MALSKFQWIFFQVSTYSHKFSQQWAINNVSAIFNRTYLDDDGVAHILDTFTLEDQFGANWYGAFSNASYLSVI